MSRTKYLKLNVKSRLITITICNNGINPEYIQKIDNASLRSAELATDLSASCIGYDITIVIEKLFELEKIIAISKKTGISPKPGIRVKLSSEEGHHRRELSFLRVAGPDAVGVYVSGRVGSRRGGAVDEKDTSNR